ncbi:hypothetical protein U0070_014107 [Myodes glareolus]|uniref:Uncharacterized protein n=1 Tax=Myodes glareolus TaxID=447135 RepID=A0AAW0JFI1_MYOGA
MTRHHSPSAGDCSSPLNGRKHQMLSMRACGLNSRRYGPQGTQLSFGSGFRTFVNTRSLGQQEVPWDTEKGRPPRDIN